MRSSNQSIADTTSTAISFSSSENWDTDTIHSTGTNPSRFTVPTGQGGVYWLYATAFFTPGAGTIRYLSLYKNGSALTTTPTHLVDAKVPWTAIFSTVLTGGREVTLAAGDYVEFHTYQDSGGALNMTYAVGGIRKVSE